MIGIHILTHSIQMIMRNYLVTIKLGLVPGLIIGVLLFIVLGSVLENNPSAVLFAVVPVVLLIAVFSVNWHRFILLEEFPDSWFPSFCLMRVLSYFSTCMIIGAVSVLMLLLLFIIFGGMVEAVGNTAFISVIIAVLSLIGMVLFYRLAIMLPAVAIEERLTIRQALAATRGAAGTLFVLALTTVSLQLFFEYCGILLTKAGFTILGDILSIVLALLLPVLNLSILTTLYGYYVEGREVSG